MRSRYADLVEFPGFDSTRQDKKKELSTEWRAKCHLWLEMLKNSSSRLDRPLYTMEELAIYCKGIGIDESEIVNWYGLFVPGKVVYLKKGAIFHPCALQEEQAPLAETVSLLLSKLPRKAIEIDLLFRVLVESEFFSVEACDDLRSDLMGSRSLQSPGAFFYDPDHVYLVTAADSVLAGGPFDRRLLPEEALKIHSVGTDPELLAQLINPGDY